MKKQIKTEISIYVTFYQLINAYIYFLYYFQYI